MKRFIKELEQLASQVEQCEGDLMLISQLEKVSLDCINNKLTYTTGFDNFKVKFNMEPTHKSCMLRASKLKKQINNKFSRGTGSVPPIKTALKWSPEKHFKQTDLVL